MQYAFQYQMRFYFLQTIQVHAVIIDDAVQQYLTLIAFYFQAFQLLQRTIGKIVELTAQLQV